MSQYCTLEEYKELGLPAVAVEEIDDAYLTKQLEDASGIIDLYLGSRYDLPILAPYPDALRRFCVCIATFHILLYRGFNPEEENDRHYEREHDNCIELLKQVADGSLNIPGIEDQTPTVNEGAPMVNTSPLRGW